MKVAYLGPAGSYTEEAAHTALPDTEHLAFPTIAHIFSALQAGKVQRAVVPVENVIEGPVGETLDCLYRHSDHVRIVDALVLPIAHALGGLTPADPLRRVLSKDQALRQCSEFFSTLDPQPTLVPTESTSAAMQAVVDGGLTDAGAVGSEVALRHYGLHVRAQDIGNIKHNKTRFAVLGPADAPSLPCTGRDTTALVLYPLRDRVGLLHDILAVLSKGHGLSCSSIHSRPDTRGAFRFYLEIEGHCTDANVVGFLDEIKTAFPGFEMEVRVFGSYPRRPFVTQRIHSVGLIGGTGPMGQWFRQFFEGVGLTVHVAGRRTPLSYESCVRQSDVVLIGVPIAHTVPMIERLGPMLREDQLLVDNTSIKTQPVAAMVACAPPGVEVLGMHTVFGPSIEGLAGENVIFTHTDSSGPRCREFEAYFHKYGARVTYTTPAHHDEQMAFHQNLEHFTKVVLAQVVRERFEDGWELDCYSSPNSRASMATLGRILSADPALCGEIQTHNLEGPKMLRAYLDAAQAIGESLMRGDSAPMVQSMRDSRESLGEDFIAALKARSRTRR